MTHTPRHNAPGSGISILPLGIAGLMFGSLFGLVAFGHQLLVPLAIAALFTAGGVIAGAFLSERERTRPADEERLQRRLAAHSAVAALDGRA